MTQEHPGAHVRAQLAKRRIGLREFARRTNLAPSYVSDLVNGRRGLSARVALLLEAELDLPAEFWLRMQLTYDVGRRSQRDAEELEGLRRLAEPEEGN